MSTNYPNSQDSYAIHQDNVSEDISAADVNNLQDAVRALETELGYGTGQPTSSATANTVMKRDSNGNAAVTDVTGNINPNLLFNPSWALGIAGWVINGSGFSINWGSNGVGTYLINSSNTTTSSVYVTQNSVNVSAGYTLTISADMDSSGVSAGAMQVGVDAYDGSGNYISTIATLSATNGTAWTRYTKTCQVTPANTSYVHVYCMLASNTTNTSSAWRRIKLEHGSIATAYSDDNTLNTVQYGSQLGGKMLVQDETLASSSDSNQQIGFGLYGSTDFGLGAFNQSVILSSGIAPLLKYNNYWDGSNDRFINNTAYAAQVKLGPIYSGQPATLSIRYSSNGPSAGTIITWGSWTKIA